MPDDEFGYHVRFLLGQCCIELQEHDAAVEHLTRALEHMPKSAQAHAQRGRAHHDKGDLDRAIADYTESIRLDPQAPLCYIGRGFAYADQDDFAKAIADASEAVRLAPNDTAPYVARATMYQDSGEYGKAAADYSRTIELEPESASFYELRAHAYRSLGAEESAAQDERTVQALTHLAQALGEAKQGNWDRALPILNQAIQLDPKLYRAYLRRGMAYIGMQEPDHAIADFNYIIDNMPKPTRTWGTAFGCYTDAFLNRGNAYILKRDFPRALADYTETIRLEPNLASAYQHRAEIYRAMGENKKAVQDERKARELLSGGECFPCEQPQTDRGALHRSGHER